MAAAGTAVTWPTTPGPEQQDDYARNSFRQDEQSKKSGRQSNVEGPSYRSKSYSISDCLTVFTEIALPIHPDHCGSTYGVLFPIIPTDILTSCTAEI